MAETNSPTEAFLDAAQNAVRAGIDAATRVAREAVDAGTDAAREVRRSLKEAVAASTNGERRTGTGKRQRSGGTDS